MKHFDTIVRVLLLLFPLTGCIEPIILDPNEKMPVVVNCVLTKDTVQTLNLFYARRPSETDYSTITDADVTITDGAHSFIFSNNGSNWTCKFTPEFDKEYFLEIKLKDGTELSAATRFPEEMYINEYPINYEQEKGGAHSRAKYYAVGGCKDEAYIWITAMKRFEDSVMNFCTNHPGADNSNVTRKIVDSLMIYQQILEYNNINSNGEDISYMFDIFFQHYSGLPCHYGYLRIHHEKYFSSEEFPIDHNGKRVCSNVFLLATDYFIPWDREFIAMPDPNILPVTINILSSEYDTYLNKVVKAGLHKDELSYLYSTDLDYTNIIGGIGIFGAKYELQLFHLTYAGEK